MTPFSHRLTVERGKRGPDMEEKRTLPAHRLTLVNRQSGTVTGVYDIHSFNESEILLETEAGKLSVKGEALHVKRLNLEKGEADIEGKIGSLTYLSKNMEKKEDSLLKRMFR